MTPWLIEKVTDAQGQVLRETPTPSVGGDELRVIDERNAFIMDSMLREVVRSGTGSAARSLGRNDLAGKTGTTSDAIDGWFAGYAADVVAVAWMGYDKPKSLGSREFGASLALPIWSTYMRQALDGKPDLERTRPAGIVFDGDWMYEEFSGENAMRTLDLDAVPPPLIPPASAQ